MNLIYGSPWAGTENALKAAVEATGKIEALMAAGGASTPPDEKPYELSDGIAVIPVKGPMLNTPLPPEWCRMFGITSYAGLQAAFAAAADDDEVKEVVLDIDSGGGHVAGLSDTLDVLAELKSRKPVKTYAGHMMASAAYWLGSAADSVSASPSSTVGSIGVISVHFSEKAAAESEGYKPTVFRAGAKKHLGHSMEDLTEEARADIQKGLDFYHSNFLNAVSSNRNIPLATLRAGVGDGRVFYGQEAVEVGLVDRIETFRSFMAGRKAETERLFYGKGGLTASAEINGPQIEDGDTAMDLQEALAKVEALQGELSNSNTALAEANARAVKAETDLAQANATKDALAASLASAKEANEAFAAVLEANIQAKAAALNTKVLMPESLGDKQKLNAQLEEEFQAAFPSGRVTGVPAAEYGDGEAKAGLPEWMKRAV